MPAERVESLLETIPLAQGAERLIRTLRMLATRPRFFRVLHVFARRLQERLGIDYVHANELEISDGV